MLANNFANKGIDQIILDVATEDTIAIYKHSLRKLQVMLLMPSYDEALKRFTLRSPTITNEEFDLLYGWQKGLTSFDKKIDNTDMSAEAVAEVIARMF